MEVIFSFYSKYDQFDYWTGQYRENNLMFMELAIKLARQFYPVTMYTDEKQAKRFKHLVDDIKILNTQGSKYKIWSQAKFEAIERHEGNFLHLDGDLFLDEKLNIPDGDIYYDHTETTLYESYYKHNLELFDKEGIKKVFPEWTKKYTGAYNIGALGFKNNSIKELYLDRYYRQLDWLYNELPIEKHHGVTSMTIGEHSLACIANHHNLTGVPLAEHNGYLHMFSSRKHLPAFVNFVKEYNKKEFKKYYELH